MPNTDFGIAVVINPAPSGNALKQVRDDLTNTEAHGVRVARKISADLATAYKWTGIDTQLVERMNVHKRQIASLGAHYEKMVDSFKVIERSAERTFMRVEDVGVHAAKRINEEFGKINYVSKFATSDTNVTGKMRSYADSIRSLAADYGQLETKLKTIERSAERTFMRVEDVGVHAAKRINEEFGKINYVSKFAGQGTNVTGQMRSHGDAIRSLSVDYGELDMKFKGLGGRVMDLVNKFGNLRNMLVGLAAVHAAKWVGEQSDAYTVMINKLAVVVGGQSAAKHTASQLYDVAQRLRLGWTDLGTIYSRTSQALQNFGLSADQTMRFTEQLGMAVKISGANTVEASNAMIQLSQGMASGALKGDELRAVLEQLPMVAKVIADGMGITYGQLREMGKAGQITTQVIIDSFEKADRSLRDGFGKTVPTIAEAWQIGKNAVINFIGAISELLKSIGIVDALAVAFGALVKVIDVAADSVRGIAHVISELGSAVQSGAKWVYGDSAFNQLKKQADDAKFSIQNLAKTMQAFSLARAMEASVEKADPLKKLALIQQQLKSNGFNPLDKGQLKAFEQQMSAVVGARNHQIMQQSQEFLRGLEMEEERFRKFDDAVYARAEKTKEEQIERLQEQHAWLRKTYDAGSISSEHFIRSSRQIRKELKEVEEQGKKTGAAVKFYVDALVLPELDVSGQIAARNKIAADARLQELNAILLQQQAQEKLNQLTEAQAVRQADHARKQMTTLMTLVQRSNDELAGMKTEAMLFNEAVAGTLASVWAQATDAVGAIGSLYSTLFNGLEDGLVAFITRTEFSFSSMIDAMMADLTRLAVRMTLMKLMDLATPAPSAVASAVTGPLSMPSADAGPSNGGPATDPSAQRVAGGSGGGIKIINVMDPADSIAAMNSSSGEKSILNVIMRNSNAIKKALR